MNLDKSRGGPFHGGRRRRLLGEHRMRGCVGAGAPILRYTWVRGAVDAGTDLRVDITRLSFGDDGVFHIESVDRFSVPRKRRAPH